MSAVEGEAPPFVERTPAKRRRLTDARVGEGEAPPFVERPTPKTEQRQFGRV